MKKCFIVLNILVIFLFCSSCTLLSSNKEYHINTNKQENGDNEVHLKSCCHFPKNNEYLGKFKSCDSALSEAIKRGYEKPDGCRCCLKQCHKR